MKRRKENQMSSFERRYSDEDQKFFREVYPLAELTLREGQRKLKQYIQFKQTEKWQKIVTALISIASDMCFYDLKQVLEQNLLEASSIKYGKITVAIDECIAKYKFKALYVDC